MFKKVENDIRKKILEKGFNKGRELSLNINKYKEEHKYERVIINGNIYIKEKEHFLKIWKGDLNLNIDGEKLKEIEKETGIRLYIINEKNGRCIIKEKEVEWNTGENIPVIDYEKIEREKKEEERRKREEEIEKDEERKNEVEKKENKKYELNFDIDKIKGKKIIKKIKIPYDKIKKNRNRRVIGSCLTKVIIEEELIEIVGRKSLEKCWITERTKKRIEEIETDICKMNERKTEKVENWINIIKIAEANKEKINIMSYGDDYIFIIE